MQKCNPMVMSCVAFLWHDVFSSAVPVLVQGPDKYTLAEGMDKRGSVLIECGVKQLVFDDGIPTIQGHNDGVG